jgi:sugar lactone lactonase YvrE
MFSEIKAMIESSNRNNREIIGTGLGLIAFVVFGGLLLLVHHPESREMIEVADNSYQYKIIGTNESGFDVPDGILWKDGNIYMADEGGSAFRIWSGINDVKTLSTPADGLQSPEDFVLDGEGNIFFTDDDAGGVWKTNEKGETRLLAGKEKGLNSTEGIALSANGEILVGDGTQHKIFSVGQDGQVQIFLDSDAGITKPESMVFDEKGNLYIADNEDHILYLLTPDKNLSKIVANQAGFSPESIWYSKGVLYITDSDNAKLFRYKPQKGLELIARFSGIFRKVSGVTTDEDENIYLSIQTHIARKHGYLLRLDRKN